MQPPISDYAMIGDGRTAALSSKEGSIDWLCLPRFDSEPIFGHLVGGERAGSFSISIDDARPASRRYRENSALMETTWRGVGQVLLTEGMVLDVSTKLLPELLLVRRVECLADACTVRIRFDPRRGLPGSEPRSERRAGALVCSWGSLAVGLRTAPDLRIVPGEETAVDLRPGESLTLLLTLADRQPLVLVDPDRALEAIEETDRWWRGWADRIEYEGPVRGAVLRSLITLRLLIYTPSGAPVAAPTTSLPEHISGERNWDYRFAWPRDASIGVAAFLQTGQPEEALSFLYWLIHASRLSRPRLNVLYTLDGRPGVEEQEVLGAPGYRDSQPVRIGNAACDQHQLDVYGWVVDAGWLLVRSGHRLDAQTWRALSALADFVCGNWRMPDAGIWEVRGEPRHHVHSKLMGWLALDRALRIARSHPTRKSRTAGWRAERDALAEEIRTRGYDVERGSYVGTYGGNDLDAALLILPTLEFDPPDSPRVGATVDAVQEDLSTGDGLIYRYPPGADGLPGEEGAFLPCSFWLVQALAAMGRSEEATELFERLCRRSNELGLLSEEIDPSSGGLLGNFPQALTHAAVVQAALALQDATAGGGTPRERPRIPRGREG